MKVDYEAPVAKCHNTRRAVLLEIILIYGTFIGLALWNWWPA